MAGEPLGGAPCWK